MNFTMMKFRAMMLCLLVMLFAGSLISCSSDDDDSPKRNSYGGYRGANFRNSHVLLYAV